MYRQKLSHLGASILIVDDCDYLSVPLEIALRTLDGFVIIRAFDVASACDILFEREVSIAAVITDLNMPTASGYDLIHLVRRSCRYRVLPIIAMSGDEPLVAAEKALLVGANAFVAKPFSLADMRRTLQRLLKEGGSRCCSADSPASK